MTIDLVSISCWLDVIVISLPGENNTSGYILIWYIDRVTWENVMEVDQIYDNVST